MSGIRTIITNRLFGPFPKCSQTASICNETKLILLSYRLNFFFTANHILISFAHHKQELPVNTVLHQI